MTSVTPPPDAVPIKVNGITITPTEHYAKDAKNTDYIILTVYNILNREQARQLIKKGVQVQEDLGNNNYLCHYEPTHLESLRALPFVRQVDVYRNRFKIPKELLALQESTRGQPQAANATFSVNVLSHAEVTDLDGLAKTLVSEVGLHQEKMTIFADKIQVQATLSQLDRIAEDDRVRILEEVIVPSLHDGEVATLVVPKPIIQGFGDYKGAGQVVSVIDTGFDIGSADDCHPAFRGSIKKLISLGRANLPTKTEAEKYDDPLGHGTHVCGTIVGKQFDTLEGLVGGVAPDAKLVVSSLMLGRREQTTIQNFEQCFGVPFREHDARVLSNSWGDSLFTQANVSYQRPYRDQAAAIDTFVRENPTAVVVFSAGNNDQKVNPAGATSLRGAVSSQAAAKNIITVGATGRSETINDVNGTRKVLNPDDMYLESSRGPTAEGRTKPDVVAPGFNIFSAYSRQKSVTCINPKTTSLEVKDVAWQVRSGTSHATPYVAGCAAILRQILIERGLHDPPAALIKAVIINGADYLPNVPRDWQGFGRVNLDDSAAMLDVTPVDVGEMSAPKEKQLILPCMGGTLTGKGLEQGERFTFHLDAPAAEQATDAFQLKITMVYNDIANGQIQNNLNLTVTDLASGKVYRGGVSEDDMTRQNNVEQVTLSGESVGPKGVRVEVYCQKMLHVLTDVQDYVVAWSLQRRFEASEN